jgi:ribose-phosphate pyrophosphokinase
MQGWHDVKWFKFPAGEVHIQLDDDLSKIGYYSVIVEHRITCSDDVILLMQFVDVLKRNKVQYMNLVLPYLPYARQDKIANSGESLSIKVFADVINRMGFEEIRTLDVHSNISTALINNCTSIYPERAWQNFFEENGKQDKNIVLVAPDAGAAKRLDVANQYFGLDIVQCLKARNKTNGKITDLKVYGDVKGKDCFIYDDICDGGATFIALAQKLKENGADDLYLFVTHGIFSKGVQELLKYYKEIACTDSYQEVYPPMIKVYQHGL